MYKGNLKGVLELPGVQRDLKGLLELPGVQRELERGTEVTFCT